MTTPTPKKKVRQRARQTTFAERAEIAKGSMSLTYPELAEKHKLSVRRIQQIVTSPEGQKIRKACEAAIHEHIVSSHIEELKTGGGYNPPLGQEAS